MVFDASHMVPLRRSGICRLFNGAMAGSVPREADCAAPGSACTLQRMRDKPMPSIGRTKRGESRAMSDSVETNGAKPLYRRVLLKISGEALMGEQGFGLDPPTVQRIAGEISRAHQLGIEICLVIGGGNIFRGLAGASQGMERAQADYMGMLATVT